MMVGFYIEQHEGFALGNFINCTPTIRALYEQHQCKIPVLFKTEYVKQCYLESEYIEIIDDPGEKHRLFGSDMINKVNTCEDWKFIYDNIIGRCDEYFQPFIDAPKSTLDFKYGVFVNGAGSEVESYLDRKLVPVEIQEIVKHHSKIPVIGIGSMNDKTRTIFDGHFGNIRDALAIINGAEWVITNATGFYHAAGAMNKKQLALWKHCRFPRNKNANPHTKHSMMQNWARDIINFLNQQNEN